MTRLHIWPSFCPPSWAREVSVVVDPSGGVRPMAVTKTVQGYLGATLRAGISPPCKGASTGHMDSLVLQSGTSVGRPSGLTYRRSETSLQPEAVSTSVAYSVTTALMVVTVNELLAGGPSRTDCQTGT